jgi:hypothetical protein
MKLGTNEKGIDFILSLNNIEIIKELQSLN